MVIHGMSQTCSDIAQLDGMLASGNHEFFAGWSERDYADAAEWSTVCKDHGWHIPARTSAPMAATGASVMPAVVPVRANVPSPVAANAASIPASPPVPPDKPDPLLTDTYYNEHFHEESLWVANHANLDIGRDRGPSSWPSAATAAQRESRLTADKIVLYCAHRSAPGEMGIRPLLWDWRRCEAAEAAAYKRLVSDNEFPAAGRGIVLGCAGMDSYLRLEHCIENLTETRKP